MRLIKFNAPQEMGARVAEVAFSIGINEVSIQQSMSHRASGEVQAKESSDRQS